VAFATVGAPSDAVYGRVYRAGHTPAVGQAPGWVAEVALGPLGTVPTGEGRCWSYQGATFNVDVANDDEYVAQVTVTAPGLYGLMFRYRPPGGTWLYGDRNGSNDGVSGAQAGILAVSDGLTAAQPLIVATLNLRCRWDDWPSRRPLVIRALARIDPDLVALQEDCVAPDGTLQADEIREQLGTFTERGYDVRRAGTHTASYGNESYGEGIAVLSAHPIEQSHTLDLPHVHFPRKALAIDVTVRGAPLRFYTTHFDYGGDAAQAREQSALAIVADLPTDRAAIVGGDLNCTPDSQAIGNLTATQVDLWAQANPSDLGLTMPADSPHSRIDYLFTKAPLGAKLLGGRILAENEGGVYLSDHRGVAIALSYP